MERWIQAGQHKVWRGKNVVDLEEGWKRKPEHEILMKKVASLIVGKTVLDVGCGIGYLCEYIHDVVYLGVDQSADMLKRARERYPNVRFMQGNLYTVELPKFDTVVCLDVLHHQHALEPALSKLKSLAKKCLIVTLWINDRDGHHTRQYIGGRGEIVTWMAEDELKQKFKGLDYTIFKSVGFVWKDIYRFTFTS